MVLYRSYYGGHDVLVRRRYQWDAHSKTYESKWEIIGEYDSNEEAAEWAERYAKLLKE